MVVSGLDEATSSGQTSNIIAATVDVYRGVSKVLKSDNEGDESAESEKLKRELKARAASFCDALTGNSAPDAAPVASASEDFLFTCQKVKQRNSAATSSTDNDQACLRGTNMLLICL